MSTVKPTIDLTLSDASNLPVKAVQQKKRAVEVAPAKVAKPVKKLKTETPHVLLWICAAGKGQGRQWKQKALRVIGVYESKQAAENKKQELMSQYECCGHGDILVGWTWEDEIDLVVRPVEEMAV